MAVERVGHHQDILLRAPPPFPPVSKDLSLVVEHEELEKMRGVLVHVRAQKLSGTVSALGPLFAKKNAPLVFAFKLERSQR